MEPWPILGLLGVLVLWGGVGLMPWFAALVARRGQGAFVTLPIAVAAGIAGGALTPAVGGKDAFGFGISLLAALAASAAAVTVALADQVRERKCPGRRNRQSLS